MRVVHVISGIDRRSGGTTVAVQQMATAQARAGLVVTVLSSFARGDDTSLADQMRASGIGVRLIGPVRRPLGWHGAMSHTLRATIAETDVVHIHALWEEIQHGAARTARRAGTPYVMTPHGMLDPWSLAQSRRVKRIYMALRLRRDLGGASAIHYTAEAERDGAAALALTAPTVVEPNGVDLDAYEALPARGAFRTRFAIGPSRPLLLFLGRVHPKKGLDLLIPALARISGGWAAPAAKPVLALVGPDADGYRSEMERLATSLGLTAQIVWTGMLEGEAKVQAYVDSDLFVLPSYQENFGIAVAEAMAAGVPVVISDKVNIDRDVLAAGAGGVVPTEVGPLAAGIERWLADPEGRRAAGTAGRAYAFHRFSWHAIAKRWADHYALFRRRVQINRSVP